MRSLNVYKSGTLVGVVESDGKLWSFQYLDDYEGVPVFWTLPTAQQHWQWDHVPSFFDGLLPEGFQLEALLKKKKIDRGDYMSQLLTVGQDLVGDVTIGET